VAKCWFWDMSEVEFLDSSGLGAVVAARKLLGMDQHLALAGLQPAVEKVLRLTHMDRVFPSIRRHTRFFLTSATGMEREPSVTNFGRYEITTSSDGQAVLRFGSGHGHVPTALSDVATFLKHEGVRLDRVEDATIALAEALNNIEEHAYAGRPTCRFCSVS
jgi:hypothetical protein